MTEDEVKALDAGCLRQFDRSIEQQYCRRQCDRRDS